MTFTNDDLKWLKEDVNSGKSIFYFDEGTITALLARLEAAEKVIALRDSEDWPKYLDLWLNSKEE